MIRTCEIENFLKLQANADLITDNNADFSKQLASSQAEDAELAKQGTVPSIFNHLTSKYPLLSLKNSHKHTWNPI